MTVRETIEEAFDHREMLEKEEVRNAVKEVIDKLDKGELRVAANTPTRETNCAADEFTTSLNGSVPSRGWQVNQWIKKAVLLYFPICEMETIEAGPFEYHDKIPLKHDYVKLGVRVVPPATARYGSYLAPGVVMMPSYVNIGAYVDSGTMVDTWATVGSCAQIGKNVHLSGGVGIGGVLEPVQAAPVIVEDNCFIGSRCIIVEGAHIGTEAVLGANTVITGSTKIIDVSNSEPVYYQGYIPPRSVVIPGSYNKHFPAGDYAVSCALIIGQRKESTDKKTSLNAALRDFGVSV